MRVSRLKTILLLSSFLLTLFLIPITARADDDDEADDYEVKARVVRLSLLDGEVNLKHNDNKDWEAAKLNYPLVEGDTVATGANSNLEIQVDSRNFIRLSANSVLRIITLRDEGIAVSAVEGTVTVRLANFDPKRGYFEIDAPKITLAAEKDGLYRIDVPKDGRVRLTVRDGGSARIYSDTSGFALRDGRAAELVVEGENAGDWDLMAAAPLDAIDDWVAERERYLAQRFKYDVKYYDEYVWGGEDLSAYGDWINTNDYGWIWRPFPSSISVYSDWAPYRYGQWTWCPPYGWTWIGYEPWGWAPYHYGRWVYYNGYWAWCPRSQFYRNRSWWRPALVAFVFDFSFGDNVCWYPLNYHQRDPYSRRYRHDRDHDRDGRRRHDDYGNWRGVTRTPRRDFGNPDRRGRGVDEPIGRRVIDRDPERGELPRRGGWGRAPVVRVSDRPTGAAERAPGVALDPDLRRTRIFHGREPRQSQPAEPNTTTPAVTTETQPTGAVARPEPRVRREPRTEPPGDTEDRRSGGRPDVTQPPRENPRVERRDREVPVVRPDSGSSDERPRVEPRTEPRSEPRESRPEPRSESPRSESPRSEPRHDSPRTESPRSESPRSESPRSESPRTESPRTVSPPTESPRTESPRSEPPRSEPPRTESPRTESPRTESPRSESPRSESPRSESPRSETPRESPRSDPETSRPKPDKPML